MKIIRTPLSLAELKTMAKARFGNLVKAVIDVERGIMALDAELHADEEAELLARGSRQENLWGINLYPELPGEDFIEFDSMINVRPSQRNMSRGVDDPKVKQSIQNIVSNLIKP